MTILISTPIPIFNDIDGQPLEAGEVYIGVAGLDPLTNPTNVYWDSALTQLAAQPIVTRGGYPLDNGAAGRLYIAGDYSMKVVNRVGNVIHSTLSTVTPGVTVVSGNLTFSGTAQRITGDFSNATVANRLMFQTSTTNSATIVGAIPNGTGTEARLSLFNNSDPTLSSGFDIRSLSTEAQLRANNYGGGNLPMTFYTGGSERVRIDTSGNVAISGNVGNAGNYESSASSYVYSYAGGVNGQVRSGVFLDGSSQVVRFLTAETTRMSITATGNIVAGANAALSTTATNGFLYVPTCAGTPTGTPTAITGMAPIVVDTTNNKLYFYSSGTWRDAGP